MWFWWPVQCVPACVGILNKDGCACRCWLEASFLFQWNIVRWSCMLMPVGEVSLQDSVFTYNNKNLWVEVFDGCSCSSKQAILSCCRNNHCIHFGNLLIDLHAHSAQACQVHCTLISAGRNKREGIRVWKRSRSFKEQSETDSSRYKYPFSLARRRAWFWESQPVLP